MGHLQLKLIVLLMLMIAENMGQATVLQSKYKKLETGQNITGTTVQELKTRSKLQCSDRCSSESECGAYQYTVSRKGNCILIQRKPSAQTGQTFFTTEQSPVYKKECLLDCQNSGRCVEENNVYSCLCPEGFNGIFCESDIDECKSMPCVHGDCSDNINNYICQCHPGYTGMNCETDVDECESMPCVNGSCSNNMNSYSCECHSGYKGINCEMEVNECDSNPCVEGTCTDMISGYHCDCSAGHYGKNCEVVPDCTPSYSWTPPTGWTGPEPAVYRSFNNLDCITLMEGTQQANFNLITGQINSAVELSRSKNQWVDLGILQEACITRPETCAAAGAAVAFWVRIRSTGSVNRGVISSWKFNVYANFWIGISASRFSHQVNLQYGRFSTYTAPPTDWTHVVLNYIGPKRGQGIRVYVDGTERASDDWESTSAAFNLTRGDGRVVVGRYYTDHDSGYEDIDVDELLFFNEKLTDEQIMVIKNMD